MILIPAQYSKTVRYMATANLSNQSSENLLNAKGMKIGIVYAEWNPEVTIPLKEGAVTTLLKY
ncbi:MAG: hypothetical protein LWW85_15960, partial [Marinilabiliales bacterium]|nr:hypothetical protein [Marinilabiliales bacterium]